MDKQRLQSLIETIKEEQQRFLADAQRQVDQRMAWYAGRIEQIEMLIKESEKAE